MSNAAQVTSEAVSAWEAGANLAPVFASAVWAYIGGLFDAPDLATLRLAALGLPRVIPGAPTLFNEVDFASGAVITMSDPPEATTPEMTAAYGRLRHEHPVLGRFEAGVTTPLAISDVTDEGGFAGTALRSEVYTALGMRDQLLIPVPVRHAKARVTLCIGRPTWGFSADEHIAAGMVQRSLQITYASLWERRAAQTADGVTRRLLERSGVQVCVVDAYGEIDGHDGRPVSLDPCVAEAIGGIARLARISPAPGGITPPGSVVAELRVETSAGEPMTVQLLASTDGEVWPVTVRHSSAVNRVAALVARGLTQRQAEMMALLLAGRTTAQAALELGISPRTAEKHITLACRALGARSRTDALVALASGDDAAPGSPLAA